MPLDTALIFRLHLGIWSHGELHQEDLPSDPVGCGRLQPGWKHRVQVPGREPGQPGEGSVLCQRVPGVQCTQVSLEFCPGFFCRMRGKRALFLLHLLSLYECKVQEPKEQTQLC